MLFLTKLLSHHLCEKSRQKHPELLNGNTNRFSHPDFSQPWVGLARPLPIPLDPMNFLGGWAEFPRKAKNSFGRRAINPRPIPCCSFLRPCFNFPPLVHQRRLAPPFAVDFHRIRASSSSTRTELSYCWPSSVLSSGVTPMRNWEQEQV